MATDLLKNIRQRIEKAGEIGKFPDWYITELMGFKNRWSTDIIVDVSDPKNPGNKKTESLKVVRVWHRLPENRWIFGGGFRFHPDVTLSQMESHAMEMSIKSWINGIPHGGSKGGCALDPFSYSEEDLINITSKIIDAAVEANVIGPYIDRWAPDVGTNENVMKWVQDHYAYEMRKQGRPQPAAAVTGKPVSYGGIPGRKEATGYGLHYAFKTFKKKLGLKLPKEPTVILQGLGNVGGYFAEFAKEENHMKITGVIDRFSGIYCPAGINVDALIKYSEASRLKTIEGFESVDKSCSKVTFEELISIGADILVPAALEDTITAEIAQKINSDPAKTQFKVLLEGANGPTAPEADQILENKGIIVIPDIYANAGGVIASYFEWEQDTHIEPFDPALHPPKEKEESLVFAAMQEAFSRNGSNIIDIQKRTRHGGKNISYRQASYIYALERVLPYFATKRRKKI